MLFLPIARLVAAKRRLAAHADPHYHRLARVMQDIPNKASTILCQGLCRPERPAAATRPSVRRRSMRVPERPPSSAPTLAFGCTTARPPQPHLDPANIRAECVNVRNKPGHRVVFMQKQERHPCVNPESRLIRPCYKNRTSLRTALEQSQSPQQPAQPAGP